jgi:ZIP family zinc transporter
MTADLQVVLSAILAFSATLSAGIVIKRFQKRIGIICAFSAGFFIALSIFELLPEIFVFQQQVEVYASDLILMALAGFLLLFALNRVFSRLYTKSHHLERKNLRPRMGLVSTAEFCSHGFLEGVAIGVSFQVQFSLGFFVAAAVIAHDFCDGISTLALMLNSGNNRRSALIMLLVDAVSPVAGAVATLFFSIQNVVLAYALAFLFGSFLQIGVLTLLPDAYRMNRPIVTIVMFLTGFFSIALFSFLVN